MGEIAEDIQDGLQCSHCGICFEKEHGHPVLCKRCYKDQYKYKVPKNKWIPRAQHREL